MSCLSEPHLSLAAPPAPATCVRQGGSGHDPRVLFYFGEFLLGHRGNGVLNVLWLLEECFLGYRHSPCQKSLLKRKISTEKEKQGEESFSLWVSAGAFYIKRKASGESSGNIVLPEHLGSGRPGASPHEQRQPPACVVLRVRGCGPGGPEGWLVRRGGCGQ